MDDLSYVPMIIKMKISLNILFRVNICMVKAGKIFPNKLKSMFWKLAYCPQSKIFPELLRIIHRRCLGKNRDRQGHIQT